MSPVSDWGGSARLLCVACGEESSPGLRFWGCPACAVRGHPEPLEVRYDYARLRTVGTLAGWAERSGGLWRFRELLPLPPGTEPLSLGEGATPLVPLDVGGPARIWLKDETRNPTGSFKDRLHAVSLAVARALGFARVTASTTGNHGTALAAYAARAGLSALVLCDPRAPVVQRRLMQLYGARVAVLPDRSAPLEWLVRDGGFYPSVGVTPAPVATPYGVEGYKTIGFELYFQLGRRFPSRVLVPSAGGDALYGPWKGFRELGLLGASGPLPRMVAVQAAGCDPIVTGWREGSARVPVHPEPRTMAISIADETGGAVSLRALHESGGSAERVEEAAIAAAMRRVARAGIAVEPAAAAGVAAALAMVERGEVGPDEDLVCVLTGAAVKWPEALADVIEPHELIDADPQALHAWVASFDPTGRADRPLPIGNALRGVGDSRSRGQASV